MEFSDFQCPFCLRVSAAIKTLEQRYPSQLRVVFRNFPLPIHKEAAKAAEAALCAEAQGAYWPMHDRLFANGGALQPADLKRHAAELGLDAAAFGRCLDSGEMAATWRRDKAEGETYGITGTPVLFINGIPVFGAVPLDELALLIDEELERVRGARRGDLAPSPGSNFAGRR